MTYSGKLELYYQVDVIDYGVGFMANLKIRLPNGTLHFTDTIPTKTKLELIERVKKEWNINITNQLETTT